MIIKKAKVPIDAAIPDNRIRAMPATKATKALKSPARKIASTKWWLLVSRYSGSPGMNMSRVYSQQVCQPVA